MLGYVAKSCKDAVLYAPIRNILGLNEKELEIIDAARENAWNRCINCFMHINNPRFNTGGIQPYHCVQYGMWLYFLSNEIYKRFPNDIDAITVCDKIFMVNMSITQMDIYYGHDMPDIFLPTHTSGVVFSPQVKIGNYFLFAHGCNIGLNVKSAEGATLGHHVIMFGHSKIIGKCNVGDYVVFGANSYIKDMDIPSHSLVFGQFPNVVIKEDKNNTAEKIIYSRFRSLEEK